MAKKKTVATKKATASAKKPTVAKKKAKVTGKKPSVQKKKPTSSAKKSTVSPDMTAITKDLQAVAKQVQTDSGIHDHRIELLPTNLMEDTIEGITSLMNDFVDVADNNLTALQRRRKRGPGVRNYGFIDKVSDLAEANPQYAQFFRLSDLKNCIRNIEMCRDLLILLQAFARAVSNTMLIYSDDAFTMALIYYNMVREMSRRGDPIAMELFNTLRIFFRRTKRITAEPTEKELERDIHSLLHGKKDGRIVIENITPKASGGGRKVVDDVHKSKAMIKESAEEQFEN
jgi:hypothetical protein